MEVPDGLGAGDERALSAAAEWLAHRGHLTVWLAGAPLRVVDRVPAVAISLPRYLAELGTEAPPAPTEPARERLFWYPPLSGQPRRDSPSEQRLEKALAANEWARGRRWNYTYEWHLLGKPYRLDVLWPEERLVVEVDGPDHRQPLKYADDRRRDVQLQLLGHAVLRFTNEEVLADVQAVVRKIEQLLSQRRIDNTRLTEMRHHVEP
jgi:very-short-patch-repair endonuclease